MGRRTATIGGLFNLAAACGVAAQVPNLIGLAGPNGSFEGNSISADGNTAAGIGQGVMRWTRQEGVNVLQGTNGGWAYGISRDGSVIVGRGGFGLGFDRAFRWTLQSGAVNLGVLAGTNTSEANGVTGDGSIVVGTCSISNATPLRAFRWTAATGMVPLVVPGATDSEANAITPDGSVIVGRADEAAYRLEGGVLQSFGLGPTGNGAVAFAVSPNGKNVVGTYFHSGFGRNLPFIWRAETGMVTLPSLGFGEYRASGVTDAQVVVGVYTNSNLTSRAWIWSPTLGIQYLTDYLVARGIANAAGLQLHDAEAINATGTVIIGLGQVPGYAGVGFRAELCYANCDDSTGAPVLNILDFTCFLQRFAAGDAYANCDFSTTPPVLNVLDFTCFLQKFAAGCS